MVKKILSLFLIAITLLSLVACGNSEEKVGKDTYFGQLKELTVTVDGKDLTVPKSYSDLVLEHGFVAHEVYRERRYEYGDNSTSVTSTVANDRFLMVYVANLDKSQYPYLDGTTVVGGTVWLGEGVELSLDVSETDTMDTIKEKYGEPDFIDYNEKNTHYYYEVPHLSTEHYDYGVSFVFDAQGTLKTVNYGDFDPIYLR